LGPVEKVEFTGQAAINCPHFMIAPTRWCFPALRDSGGSHCSKPWRAACR
jgi:hypothetical protein